MHELALAESIVSAITERLGGERVVTVRLRVGRLAAVMPDALRFGFDVCAQGSCAEGARVEIADVPGHGTCRDCGASFELWDLLTPCSCGGVRLDVSGGEDLEIEAVEVI